MSSIGASSSKRKYVGEEETEKSTKRKIEKMSDGNKDNIIHYAIVLARNVCIAGNLSPSILYEVLPSTTIFSVAYRIYDYARTKANKAANPGYVSTKMEVREGQSFAFKIDGESIAITNAIALEAHKNALDEYKIKSKNATMAEIEFFSESATIMALLALFGQRLKELQIGPDSWTYTKKEGKSSYVNLKTYGIESQYRHMVSGLSWDPKIRSTLAKHTTGLCQLAILCASTDKKYSNKNKTNVERDFGFLKHIGVISNFLQTGGPEQGAAIIDKMAHITYLHGDRHKRRNSPCFSSIVSVCMKLEEAAGMETDNESASFAKYIIDVPQGIIGFSSKKSVLLYNSNAKIIIPHGVNAEMFKQIYFHATFGTHGEDFGVLKFMTRQSNWFVREQFKTDKYDFFSAIKPSAAKRATTEEKIIPIHYYSKNISATQSNMLSDAGEITGTVPVFAGMRMKRIKREILNAILEKKGAIRYTLEPSQSAILDYLSSVIVTLKNEWEKSGDDDILSHMEGRAKWRDVSGAGSEKGVDGDEINDVCQETLCSFWCKKM